MTLVTQATAQRAEARLSSVVVHLHGVASNIGATPRYGIPASIPRDQLYYWTSKWQRDEAESLEELRQGKSRVFPNARAAVSALFEAEDDDE